MKGSVYKIENIITSEFYVGSSTDVRKRFLTHKNNLRNNRHKNKNLQTAYNEYGESSFKFYIVKESEDCRKDEEEIIKNSDKIYNMKMFACGGDMISNHPDRERIIEKSTEILRRYKVGPRFGEKNSNWRGGISKSKCKSCGVDISSSNTKCSDCYYKERDISGDKNPFFNKKHSEESRKKISEARTGKPNLICSKAIIIDNIEYRNANEAQKVIGVKAATIRHRVVSKNPLFSNYYYKEKL